MSKAASLLLTLVLPLAQSLASDAVISVNSLSAISENFDSMGSANNALLPLGWQFNISSGFPGFSSSTYAAGTSGVGAISQSSRGGFYNFGDGINASTTDRAPGFLIDATFTPNKSLSVGFRN